jgi:hypothetical protein
LFSDAYCFFQEVVEMRESKNNKNSVPKGWRIGVSSEDANILVEEVKKDVSALSKEEQMNVVMRYSLHANLFRIIILWRNLHN